MSESQNEQDKRKSMLKSSAYQESSREKVERWEYGVAFGLYALVLGATFLIQPHTTVGNGIGWDGQAYRGLAIDVAAGVPLVGSTPFIYRIGLPYFAGTFFPDHLKLGFLSLSIPCVLLSVLPFYALLASVVRRRWIRFACLVVFAMQYHGAARFTPFRSFMVDPPGQLAVFLGIWLAHRWAINRKNSTLIGMCLTVTVGVVFREMAIIPALVFLVAHQPFSKSDGARLGFKIRLPNLMQWLPILCGLLAFMTVRKLVTPRMEVEAYVSFLTLFKGKIPFALPVSVMLTFGPVLIVALGSWRKIYDFSKNRQHLLMTVLLFFSLAWIGGSDTERLFAYSAPAAFALIGVVLDATDLKKDRWWLLGLVVAQALTQRWFFLLPNIESGADFAIFTAVGENTSYLDLWGSHASRKIRWLLFLEFIPLAAAAFWFGRKLDRRTGAVALAQS